MATTGRASDTPVTTIASDVAARLLEEPFCFEFFQAVRLLERLRPDRMPVGRFARPSEEVVQFRANPTLSFPASEIQSLQEGKNGQAAMSLNFMGMTAPRGTLPLYYTDLMIGRIMARDHTMRDFFDLFHHRIISLFYRAWQKYRFQFRRELNDYDGFSRYLLDSFGLGTKGLQERQAMADESLLSYSGLLAQQPRSATALRLLLADYFQAPVEIEQFVGAWYRL